MQSKGLIKFLFIVFVIVAVVQGLFILPTQKVEKDAVAYGKEMADKTSNAKEKYTVQKMAQASYLDSMSTENIFSIPLVKKYTYDDLKKQQLALGLDLKGGYSSVLQVDLRELLTALARNTKDATFVRALDKADSDLTSSQSDYITLFGNAFNADNDGKKLSKFFYRSLSEDINTQTGDGEVLRVLRTKADETVNLTFNLLKQRIDKLGVTQPNISLDAARDLILVEMPGVDNPERARKMLQSSARLEFWDVYLLSDGVVSDQFLRADEILKRKQSGDTTQVNDLDLIEYDTIYQPQFDTLGNTIDSTMELIEKPKDAFSNQGPLLSLLELNRVTDGRIQYSNSVFGVAEKNKRNAVMEMLNSPEIARLFPNDGMFRWSQKPSKDYETGEYTNKYELYIIKKKPGMDGAPLEGDMIISASQSPDPTTGEIAVNLGMNNQGAKIWADMTTKAAQAGNRPIAILLDDEVLSAPTVNSPITGGRSQITGNYSVAEASDFANMLEIGKLPARVNSIQEANIGPSLGKENIRRSFISLASGVLLVLLFMVMYYGGAGIVSIIALLLNLLFIFGALSSFGTVVTLPGIAGIVLTIGMAVDANVIIYERIREELRAGKSMLASISDGFKHSYSAIIDANVTTILVAFVLAYFGLGPIKGFAVVLIIGVLSSLFTAVLMGRYMIDWWTKDKGNNITFWTGFSKNMFANMNIDWIGKRKIAYVISGVVIAAGLISMFTRGFDLGVDFKGGYSYTVQFDESADMEAQTIRDGLSSVFGEGTVVKAVDTRNTFNIVTDYNINDTDEGAANKVVEALYSGINSISGGGLQLADFKNADSQTGTHLISSSKVGPTIADDIKSSSYKAGIFALILIFLYIFLRFNKWQYSLGAVTALFHDSLIVMSVFSLLHGILPISMELDQNFIAAILTVIGYSINDTVVVFDRIREYLGIYTNKSTDDVLNLAINSTFSRTVITSLTTLLVVSILLVFGGASTKGFALALFVGIVVGTYSSIFVATPIVRDFSDELKPKNATQNKKSFSRAGK